MLNIPQLIAPRRWEDYHGNDDIVISTLNALSLGPNAIPRSIFITGFTGTGKTTLVSLIIRSLTCSNPEDYEHNGISYPKVNPCGKCNYCQKITDFRQASTEFTNITHVQVGSYGSEDMTPYKQVQHALDMASRPAAVLNPHRDNYRFIIFDEWQCFDVGLRQKVLLKTEVENELKVIYFFVTMQANRLPEIDLVSLGSRGVHWTIVGHNEEQIVNYLLKVSNLNLLPKLNSEIAKQIAKRAKGSLREALSKYEMLALRDCMYSEIQDDTARRMLRFTTAKDRLGVWEALERGQLQELNHIVSRAAKVYDAGQMFEFGQDLIDDLNYAIKEQRGNTESLLFALRLMYQYLANYNRLNLADYLIQLSGLRLGLCS